MSDPTPTLPPKADDRGSRRVIVGTVTSNTGVRTELPINSANRPSPGGTTRATHAGNNSGRVVSTSRIPPSCCEKASRTAVPGTGRSSSSACAIAVRKSTSHNVGASAV